MNNSKKEMMRNTAKTLIAAITIIICSFTTDKVFASEALTGYCERTVSNTILCRNTERYVMYLDGPITGGLHFYNEDLIWIEHDNGTVTIQGSVRNTRTGRAEVNITLSGKRSNQNHKPHICRSSDGSGYEYYSKWDGTISVGDNVMQIKKDGPDFQVGVNANVTSSRSTYGGSGWFEVKNTSLFTHGDINIILGEKCENTPNEVCNEDELVYWSMDSCDPEGRGSSQNCDSNAPVIEQGACVKIWASPPCRSRKDFSCREGKKGSAVCFDLDKGSVYIDVTIQPQDGEKGSLSGLSVYTASANRDSDYKFRVYKRGRKIYERRDVEIKKGVFQLNEFDFSSDSDFVVDKATTFTFRFTGDEIIELDEMVLKGGCCGDDVPCDIIADAGPDKTVCKGESTYLGSDGILPEAKYRWSNGANSPIISVSPSSTTTYTLTVSEGNCSDTDEVTVTVESVKADAGPNRKVCKGESVTIGSDGIIPDAIYKWSTGQGGALISVSPSESSVYELTVTVNGCSDVDKVYVEVEECKRCDVIVGETLSFNSSGGQSSSDYVTQYILVNQNGRISDIQDNPSFVPSVEGDYRIFAVNYSKSESINLNIGGDLSDIEQECVDISSAISCTVCPPTHNGGGGDCDDYNFEDFERGWGIWNDGGHDSFRKRFSNAASSGNYSIRLRDNTSGSDMFTDRLDFSDAQSVELSFHYKSYGFDNQRERFVVEVSSDGGNSFKVIQSFYYDIDFQNYVGDQAQVVISKQYLSNRTVLRIKSDASSNYDVVYIDDVLIKACTGEDNDDDDMDDNDDQNQDPAICNGPQIDKEGFESSLGIWNDGGSDCYRLNNFEVAKDGKYSVRLRDNSRGSNLYSDKMDLSDVNGLEISFDYLTDGFSGTEEDFMVEVSRNGGVTFSTIQKFAHGVDFENGKRYSISVYIDKSELSDNTVLRLRCDASSNSDQVFIDNIILKSCGGNPGLLDAGLVQSRSIENKLDNESYDFELSPNPAQTFTRLDLEEVHGKNITIEIFSSLGGFVKSIPMDRVSERFLSIDLDEFSGGVYLVRMQVDDTYIIKKLTIGK